MFPNRKVVTAGAATLLIVLPFVFHCKLPPDLDNPANTTVSIVLRTATWKQDSESIVDTVGNAVLIGAALHLPVNIDSIAMMISGDGTTLFDTVFSDFSSERDDTVWKTMTFLTGGGKTVTVIPYSPLTRSPVTAIITIMNRPGPANTAPSISVSGKTAIAPGQTCSLTVHASDSDDDQTVQVSMKGEPEETELKDDSLFTWNGG